MAWNMPNAKKIFGGEWNGYGIYVDAKSKFVSRVVGDEESGAILKTYVYIYVVDEDTGDAVKMRTYLSLENYQEDFRKWAESESDYYASQDKKNWNIIKDLIDRHNWVRDDKGLLKNLKNYFYKENFVGVVKDTWVL
jgi:hypothetical protein